ncbi:MAG: protein translocase subunit SecD [Filifactoraceae bacterium]
MKGKNSNKLTLFLIVVILAVFSFTATMGMNLGGLNIDPLGKSIKQGLDLKGGVFVVYEAQTDKTGADLAAIIDETIEVFRRRVDGMGLTEPVIVKEGEKRIRIELPGVTDVQQAIDTIGRTAILQFVMPDGRVAATGSEVEDAKLAYSQTNLPIVSLKFNSEGTKKFADATTELAPTKGVLAIVLDGEAISKPAVENPIVNGSAQITGNFTAESAAQLAGLIRSGALPVEFKEVQSSVITASLGVDALSKSLIGGAIGIILVMLFMAIFYRLPGIAADIALVGYILIVAYIYVIMGATITLPGIAALILSVGMAVDANVIIFERIKEEIAIGKTIRVAIESGFKKSLSTILDSQITTFIAGMVLYYFGTGQIKGFAITLMIGIFASLFTAQIVTRVILKLIVDVFNIKDIKLFGVKGGASNDR